MRLVFVFIFLPFLFLFSQTNIVGGEDADIEDYSYQAALTTATGWWGFCGASIINEYWILTAAHCVSDESASGIAVRVGTDASYAQGGESYDVAEIILHENYNSNANNWDIALIRLDDPITFNNSTQPVLLICDQQVELGVQDPGEMSWITGWGEDEGTANSTQLQVVGVPITTESNYWGGVEDDEIMAGYPDGGYDSCQGDSGGPMVVLAADGETFLQVGIVSWGSGCAESGYPGVYSRVSYFIDWICENTNGDVCPNESLFCNGDAVYGCTDISAENYNVDATINDGTCEYVCDQTASLMISFDCWPEEIGWSIVNENGAVVASQNTNYYSAPAIEENICLSVGCYIFTITDSYGDGLGGSQWGSCSIDGSYEIISNLESIVSGEGDFGSSNSHNFCIENITYGCIDAMACNYNFLATVDDDSCVYALENYDCGGDCILELDCNGECGGGLIIDECGECGGNGILEGACDCDGNIDLGCGCGNPAPLDGYDCNGDCILELDCNGECGGDLIIDECGECGGNGILEGACDCDGNVDLGCGCGNPAPLDGYDCDGNSIILIQYIDLHAGWNLWSTYIEEPGSMISVFEEIESNVIIIKDENGNVYWPEYELNSIGNLTIGAGYQIKMSSDATLLLSGLAVSYDQPINLDQGWNLIGYLHQEAGDITSFFSPFQEGFEIIKDENGNVYWPEYGLNSIVNMLPGRAYQIKTLFNFSFSYPDLVDGRHSFSDKIDNLYFDHPNVTGNNMTVLFPMHTRNHIFNLNDEIGVYDQHGLLIGTSIILGEYTAVTIWGDDLTTSEKDGASEGEKLLFKFWDYHDNTEYQIDVFFEEGSSYYAIDAVNVVDFFQLDIDAGVNQDLIYIVDVLGRHILSADRRGLLLYRYSDGLVKIKLNN